MTNKLLNSATVLLFLAVSSAAQQSSPATGAADASALKQQLERAETRLRDWPQLGRYAEANAQVQAPAKNELRVVFMGDSITDSWDAEGYGGFFPGRPYINRGISGQTTSQMLIRFRPDVVKLRPRVVVILAGTNDIAGNTGPTTLEAIEDNLASMAELARAGGIRVVFASVLPVSDYGRNREGQPVQQTGRRPPAKILELNRWIKDYAARSNHTYLNYFDAVVDDKGMLKAELGDDGLHPNAKGYAVMGPLAEAAIKEAMKRKS